LRLECDWNKQTPGQWKNEGEKVERKENNFLSFCYNDTNNKQTMFFRPNKAKATCSDTF
jgi:hypothetical protein